MLQPYRTRLSSCKYIVNMRDQVTLMQLYCEDPEQWHSEYSHRCSHSATACRRRSTGFLAEDLSTGRIKSRAIQGIETITETVTAFNISSLDTALSAHSDHQSRQSSSLLIMG